MDITLGFYLIKSAYRRCYYKLQMSYLSHEISFLPHSQQLVRRPHSVSRYLWGALPVGVTQVWCCSCSFLYWSTNSHSQSPSSLQSPAHPEPKHRRNLSLLRGGEASRVGVPVLACGVWPLCGASWEARRLHVRTERPRARFFLELVLARSS